MAGFATANTPNRKRQAHRGFKSDGTDADGSPRILDQRAMLSNRQPASIPAKNRISDDSFRNFQE